ncbi:hypothetical protein H0H87_008487, partial [Tephrocybe sp. NHM501043]
MDSSQLADSSLAPSANLSDPPSEAVGAPVPDAEPPAKTSPYKKAAQTGYESSQRKLPIYRDKLNKEMAGTWVGPMPPDQFLDDFFRPVPDVPDLPNDHFTTVPTKGLEKDMYQPFIECAKGIIPGFKIINTAEHSDINSTNGYKLKPDPTMYADTVDTVEKRTQFDKVELNIEFKRDPLHDPFVDSGVPGFEAQSQNSRDTRSQLTHYTTEIFSRQHRLFTFTLFICHEQARFIRWDRA